MATFDSTTKRTKVEVFHEARKANSSVDRNQWASTTVAFAPTHMYAIRDKAGPDGARATRVILIRDHTDSLHMGSVPLIIDPEKRSVEIANFFLPENSRHAEYVEAGDTFYSYHYGTAYNHKLRVLRFYFPGRMPEVAVDEMPFSPWMTCREGETFHMLEAKSGFFDSTGTLMHHDTAATFHLNENFYYWHTWKEGTNRPQLVGVDIPRVTLIAVSNHYGLVAALSPRKKDPPDPSLLHSVTFDPPPPKK